jgi:hypothetical protein
LKQVVLAYALVAQQGVGDYVLIVVEQLEFGLGRGGAERELQYKGIILEHFEVSSKGGGEPSQDRQQKNFGHRNHLYICKHRV